MARIEVDWPTWNALPEAQQDDMRNCTGRRLGAPSFVYSSYDAEGNGVGDPLSVFWDHPSLGPEDLVYCGLIAGASVALVKVVRSAADEDTWEADPAGWPTDPETGLVVRSRADVRAAAQWWHRDRVAAFRAAVAAADPDVEDAFDIAVKEGSAAVDDGRRDRRVDPSHPSSEGPRGRPEGAGR